MLDQCNLIINIYNKWGKDSNTDNILSPTMNDRLRIFGIMALEEFRDDLELLFVGKSSNRAGLDDPELRKKAFIAVLQMHLIMKV